jgi:uncharacterized protein
VILLGPALAALIGLSLGLLGGGGSILTVPILVYVLGFGAKEAIAMSLAIVGATSLFGAVKHFRIGNVDLRVALLFGGVSMGGTYLGARLAIYFTGAAQLTLFAVVMLAAAYFMLRDRSPTVAFPPVQDAVLPRDGAGAARSPIARRIAARSSVLPSLLIMFEGVGVGVLTGLVGVGGGFLIVPALVLLARVPMKQAIGTSLLVIAMKSAAGFLGYLGQVEIPWSFLAVFTAVSMVGIFGGTYLVQFVSQHALKRAFAYFLIVMGFFILYQNRDVFSAAALSAVAPVSPGSVATSASPVPWALTRGGVSRTEQGARRSN